MSDPEDHSADELQDPARGDMPVRDADFARRREQLTDGPEDDEEGADGGAGDDEPQEDGSEADEPQEDESEADDG